LSYFKNLKVTDKELRSTEKSMGYKGWPDNGCQLPAGLELKSSVLTSWGSRFEICLQLKPFQVNYILRLSLIEKNQKVFSKQF
jgi:hypothetical protein